MKYHLTKNTLKSQSLEIKISPKKGHIFIELNYKNNNRLNKLKVLSNIKDDINKFENKVILIHLYKHFEYANMNKKVLKQLIINTNYAEVFGSPWL